MAAKTRRPRVGDVYYEPCRDDILVVRRHLAHFGTLLGHPYPASVRCIFDGSWPEGLVYVGRLE